MIVGAMTLPPSSVLQRRFLQGTVAKLKPRTAHCLPLAASVQDVLRLFEMAHAGSVVILDDNERLAGIFTERDLLTKHKPGRALDTIKMPEVMTTPVQVIKSNASIARLMYLIALGGFRHVPVCDKAGEAPRMISARDIIDFIYKAITKDLIAPVEHEAIDEHMVKKLFDANAGKPSPTPVEHEVVDELVVKKFFEANISNLNPAPVTLLSSKAMVAEAFKLLGSQNIGCVVVSTEHNPLAGILTERDIVTRVLLKGLNVDKIRVSEVMTENPVHLSSDTTISKAFNLMSEGGCRHIPIVSREGQPSGIVSIKGLINALTQSVIQELQEAKH